MKKIQASVLILTVILTFFGCSGESTKDAGNTASNAFSGENESLFISLAQKKEGCPMPDARGAYLCNADTGCELFSKNSDKRLPMASTTKLMTALVVSELMSFDTVVTVPRSCVGVEGSSMYLYEGEKISVKTLIYGLLLESANDAAETLAVVSSGSIENFAALMNKKARDMGLENTNFTNPHGLDDEDHYTTARELAVIACHALKNEDIKTVVGTKTYKAKVQGEDTYRHMTNHNRLLFTYDGAVGMKTGFTKRTGRCLVSAAQRDGMTLVCVTLGASNDWQAHRLMLDFGFNNYKCTTAFTKSEMTVTLPVFGNGNPLQVAPAKDVKLFVNKDHKTDLPGGGLRIEYQSITPVFPPLKRGPFGTALIYYKDKEMGKLYLYRQD